MPNWSDTAIKVLPVRSRSMLDDCHRDSADLHDVWQDDRNLEPGTLEWARIHDRALYRRLSLEKYRPRCHSRQKIMAAVAKETLDMLPTLLSARARIDAETSLMYNLHTTPRLPFDFMEEASGTKYKRIRIKVVNADALDAALSLELEQAWQDDEWIVRGRPHTVARDTSKSDNSSKDSDDNSASTDESAYRIKTYRARTRKVILNVTSATGKLGGHWQQGSLATEEERLCFRTSLSMALPDADEEVPEAKSRAGDQTKTEGPQPPAEEKGNDWKSRLARYAHAQGWTVEPPLHAGEALYTRDVVVLRNPMHVGSSLFEAARTNAPNKLLPMVSVITMTPVHRPLWRRGEDMTPEYAQNEVRSYLKNKMRLVLRIAVDRRHDSLVLGSLGCEKSPFSRRPDTLAGNPAHAVAACWREVLMEAEFSGNGWFRDIYFAVPEERGDDTYSIFHETLHGLEV